MAEQMKTADEMVEAFKPKQDKGGHIVPEYRLTPRQDPRIEEHSEKFKALGITFTSRADGGLKVNIPRDFKIMYENSAKPGLVNLPQDFNLVYSKDTLKVVSVDTFTIGGKGNGPMQITNIISQNRDGTTDRIMLSKDR